MKQSETKRTMLARTKNIENNQMCFTKRAKTASKNTKPKLKKTAK